MTTRNPLVMASGRLQQLQSGDSLGPRSVSVCVFGSGTTVSTGEGTIGFCVPVSMNGLNLSAATAAVATAGATSGTTDVAIRRKRSGSDVEMLTAAITLATATYTASNGTIGNSNKNVATGDLIFIDVDAVNGTAPVGLSVALTFS